MSASKGNSGVGNLGSPEASLNQFPDSFRTPRTSGTIIAVFGVLMVAFGTLALLMVVAQRLLFLSMPPPPQDPDFVKFMNTMHAVHRVWLLYMPLMIAGGLVFAIAGIGLVLGSRIARRVAQANAVLGYLWLLAYGVSCYGVMSLFEELSGLPMKLFGLASIIVTTLIFATVPTGLLYLLNRPLPHADSKQPAP